MVAENSCGLKTKAKTPLHSVVSGNTLVAWKQEQKHDHIFAITLWKQAPEIFKAAQQLS